MDKIVLYVIFSVLVSVNDHDFRIGLKPAGSLYKFETLSIQLKSRYTHCLKQSKQ